MSSSEVPQPHDSLVRHTFGQLEHAASFFRENLPPALAAAIQWDKLRLLSGSFVDEELRQSQSDLLYEAPFREGAEGVGGETSVLFYLLFEHHSTRYRWMPLRLLCYTGRIWQRQIDERPGIAGLSPIIPMVLAQVAGGWKVSQHFHDQILWPKTPQLRESLARYQPQFEHGLIDLAGIDLKALRGNVVTRLTQGLLKIRIDGDDGTCVEWAFPLLAEADRMKTGPDSLLPLIKYLLSVTSLKAEDFRARLLAGPLSRETTQSIMTLADQLMHDGLVRGRQEGREEGHEKGLEEGALIGQVQLLERLLGWSARPASELAGISKDDLESRIAGLERELSTRLK